MTPTELMLKKALEACITDEVSQQSMWARTRMYQINNIARAALANLKKEDETHDHDHTL